VTAMSFRVLVLCVLCGSAPSGFAKPGLGQPAERDDVQPLLGASYSSALGLSGRTALTWGSRSVCTDGMFGPFVQAEFGKGGGRIGAGGTATASDGLFPMAALAAQLFVLRSWSTSSGLPAHQTYVGAEIKMTLFYANVGLSGYQRLTGQRGGARGILVSVGGGF